MAKPEFSTNIPKEIPQREGLGNEQLLELVSRIPEIGQFPEHFDITIAKEGGSRFNKEIIYGQCKEGMDFKQRFEDYQKIAKEKIKEGNNLVSFSLTFIDYDDIWHEKTEIIIAPEIVIFERKSQGPLKDNPSPKRVMNWFKEVCTPVYNKGELIENFTDNVIRCSVPYKK